MQLPALGFAIAGEPSIEQRDGGNLRLGGGTLLVDPFLRVFHLEPQAEADVG